MEQILNKILSTTSTVILPHFGAILKIGTGYQFNEFLKYNDGKLIAAIEEENGISKDKATEVVSDFIRSIKESLNANKDFELKGIGIITKKDGKVILISDSSNKKSAPVGKTKSVVNPKKSIPKSKENKVTEPIKSEEKNTPKTKEPIVEQKKPSKVVKEKKENTEEELPKAYTSANLVIDRAIEKVLGLKTIDELDSFAKGENRDQVLTAIKTKKVALSKNEVPPTPIKGKTKTETPKVEEKKTTTPPKKEIKLDKPIKEELKETAKPGSKKEDKKIIPVVLPKVDAEKKIEPIKKEEKKTPPFIDSKVEIKKEDKKIEVTPVPLASKKETPKIEVNKAKTPSKKEEQKIERELMAGALVIEKEAKKRKRNRLILWVAILLLLIGSSIIGYLKKNEIFALINKTEIAEHKKTDVTHNEKKSDNHNEKVKTPTKVTSTAVDDHTVNIKEEAVTEVTPSSETGVEEEKAIVEEEVIEEQKDIVKEEEIPENKEEEIIIEEVVEDVKPAVSKGKYNIIGGAFSSESNADKLVAQLKKDGYSNAKMIGQYGNLYTVSIDNFATRNDAKSTLSDIKAKGYSGWIKKI